MDPADPAFDCGAVLESHANPMMLRMRDLRVPIVAAVVNDGETRRLLLGFESLGDGCEFGEVQRRYGAAPRGLAPAAPSLRTAA